MEILVICARRTEPHFTTFPLRVFKNALRDLNINVTIVHDPYPRNLKRFDVVCLVDQYLRLILEKTGDNSIPHLIEQYRRLNKPVIWLDANDSAGPIRREVLERVNVYALRQILKDRSAYLQPMYQGIWFKDYYRKQFQLGEQGGIFSAPVPTEQISKLAIYWNLGLIDWRIQGVRRLRRTLGILLPNPTYQMNSIPPQLSCRSIDISYRVSKRQQEIVDFHRERVWQELTALADHRDVRHTGKIPYRAYLQEMRQAKIAPSPFGWGEICYRDFEGFAAGALVVKPDMSHLETFPHYFEADQTYVPHRWDFTDLRAKLEHILDHPDLHENIAENGQKRFLESLKDATGFAQHFAHLIDLAVH